MNKLQSKQGILLLSILSSAIYFWFSYFLDRNDFIQLFLAYTAVFASFLVLKNHQNTLYIGLAFRLVFLFALPALSQDYLRFIWDGRILNAGFNPFIFTPNSLLKTSAFSIAQSQELWAGMGTLSAQHFSNYPPISQFIFLLTAKIAPANILWAAVAMRFFLISAEVGIYFSLKKILSKSSIPSQFLNLYWLNPLIIIELTGNLHFEGLMIFFLCLSLYFIQTQKNNLAAIFFGLSILAKLFPLFFLPLIFTFLPFKKAILFICIVFLIVIIGFSPFLDIQLIQNYTRTVGLWFGKFEFNASIYYLIRQLGFWFTGYNLIFWITKVLPLIPIALMFKLMIRSRNQDFEKYLKYILGVATIYFLISSTVHPWYLSTLIFFGVFFNSKYLLVWSFTIIFSYAAYSNLYFKENPLLLFIEYLPVFGCLIFENKSRFNFFIRDKRI